MIVSSPQISRFRRKEAFTLIELLLVIAVILLLAGITFGITKGVQNAQARAKAKAELATISQALEQFKNRYGDYPWHDSNDGSYPAPLAPNQAEKPNVMLLYALTGRLVMERDTSGKVVVDKVGDSLKDEAVLDKPKFIDHKKFSTYDRSDDQPVALLDPWGNPYIYWYKWENTPGDWDVFGYHLYSMGPKGTAANKAIKTKINNLVTGVLEDDFREIANREGIIFVGE
jgi:prepilin-type N-terminal cleavage/methylation domain-containing protein